MENDYEIVNLRGIFQKKPRAASEGNFFVAKERELLWSAATGYSSGAYFTKFFFIYLAGLVAARRQFIPGFSYFMNSHFNWLGAGKYLIAGWATGTTVSTFTFGHPFLLEDYFRGYIRSICDVPKIERQTFNRSLKWYMDDNPVRGHVLYEENDK